MSSPDSPRRVTIRDIAASLGLSPASVSLGLRNNPLMAAATCRRIQEAARTMGYEPNLSAASLAQIRHTASNRSIHSAIAWINCWQLPEQLRQYRQFEAYWQSATHTANAAGFRIEEFVVPPDGNIKRLQNVLLTRNIRAIIIPPHGQSGHWGKMVDGTFDWIQFSAVRIGHSVTRPEVFVVAPDQVGNAF